MTFEQSPWDNESIDETKRQMTLQVAAEIGFQNTTIFDLEQEIIEKLDANYSLNDMIKYLDEIMPGSARRIANLTHESRQAADNSPEHQARHHEELQQAFIAGYNSHKAS
jgi:hypothetical protein